MNRPSSSVLVAAALFFSSCPAVTAAGAVAPSAISTAVGLAAEEQSVDVLEPEWLVAGGSSNALDVDDPSMVTPDAAVVADGVYFGPGYRLVHRPADMRPGSGAVLGGRFSYLSADGWTAYSENFDGTDRHAHRFGVSDKFLAFIPGGWLEARDTGWYQSAVFRVNWVGDGVDSGTRVADLAPAQAAGMLVQSPKYSADAVAFVVRHDMVVWSASLRYDFAAGGLAVIASPSVFCCSIAAVNGRSLLQVSYGGASPGYRVELFTPAGKSNTWVANVQYIEVFFLGNQPAWSGQADETSPREYFVGNPDSSVTSLGFEPWFANRKVLSVGSTVYATDGRYGVVVTTAAGSPQVPLAPAADRRPLTISAVSQEGARTSWIDDSAVQDGSPYPFSQWAAWQRTLTSAGPGPERAVDGNVAPYAIGTHGNDTYLWDRTLDTVLKKISATGDVATRQLEHGREERFQFTSDELLLPGPLRTRTGQAPSGLLLRQSDLTGTTTEHTLMSDRWLIDRYPDPAGFGGVVTKVVDRTGAIATREIPTQSDDLLHLDGSVLTHVVTTASTFCNSCQPRIGVTDLSVPGLNTYWADIPGMNYAVDISGRDGWLVVSGGSVSSTSDRAPVVQLFQSGVVRPTAILDGATGLADVDSTGTVWVVDGPDGDALVGAPLPARTAVTGMGGMFVAVTPTRILDTRYAGASGALRPNQTITVGTGGPLAPSGATAVVLNLTATEPSAGGYLTAYASGSAPPTTSNVNFTVGQTVPNLVTVPVSPDGSISITNFSQGTTHVIADVAGYYQRGDPTRPGAFTAVGPSRIVDSRAGLGVPSRIAPNGAVTVQVSNRGDLPDAGRIAAVVANVTVTRPTAAGYLTIYPAGGVEPLVSNLNFSTAETVPNLVTVPLSNGKLTIRNGSAGFTDVIVDIAGYYLAGTPVDPGAFVAVTPTRVVDSRGNLGVSGALGPLADAVVDLERAGVTTGPAAAVVANLTVTQPAVSGFLTAYPSGSTMPTASNVNFRSGQTVPNLVVTEVAGGSDLAIFNGSTGASHVILDVAGYFIG